MTKKLVCSAGFNYAMVYPNGDIYRCMRDYNTRSKPISNIDSNEDFFNKPTECNQKICDASCDADWSTKWLVNNQKIKKIPASGWDNVVSINPWADQDINSKDKTHCMIIWAPTLPCNYTCSYCGCAAGTGKIYKNFPSSNPEKNTNEWINFFKKIKNKYKWALIQTNGGEPLTHDASIPVFELLSDKFAINLITNLSVKISEIIRSDINPFNVKTNIGFRLTASLHPTSKGFNFDLFLGKLLLLKNHNYLRGVNFVGWPEQLYLYDYYKKILNEYNIQLWLQPWIGPDNSGYEKYLPVEEKYIEKNTHSSRSLNNQYDFSDYVKLAKYESILKVLNYKISNKHISFNVEIKNTGDLTLKSTDEIKLGFKVLRKVFGLRNAEIEFRAEITEEIKTEDKKVISVNINLEEVPNGNYSLVIDLLKENEFWFEQLGNSVLEYNLKITKGSAQLTKTIPIKVKT